MKNIKFAIGLAVAFMFVGCNKSTTEDATNAANTSNATAEVSSNGTVQIDAKFEETVKQLITKGRQKNSIQPEEKRKLIQVVNIAITTDTPNHFIAYYMLKDVTGGVYPLKAEFMVNSKGDIIFEDNNINLY